MSNNSKTKSAKKRVAVQEIPTEEKNLTEKEMKEVKGGLNFSKEQKVVVNHEEQFTGGVRTSSAFGDGSVRTNVSSITDGTSNTLIGEK